MQLTDEAVRVLGCLVEKELATPEYYPLSVNALMLACNQKTNRDPVMTLDESAVGVALEGLRQAGLAHRSAEGGRVSKYAHNVATKLALDAEEVAVLAVLLLRGPQTPGELRTRAERMHAFKDLAHIEAALDRLKEGDTPLVVQLERVPGHKEHRYAHLLAGPPSLSSARPPSIDAPASTPDDRVTRLEQELDALRAEVRALQTELAELKAQLS